jgi:hypothetical protein
MPRGGAWAPWRPLWGCEVCMWHDFCPNSDSFGLHGVELCLLQLQCRAQRHKAVLDCLLTQPLQELRSENAQLQHSADAAREVAARLEAECARLKRDNARLAANAVRGRAAAKGATTVLLCTSYQGTLVAAPHPLLAIWRTTPFWLRRCIMQAECQGDVDTTIMGLEARCSRLSAELEETALAAQVASAKGRAYDELEAKAERLVGGDGRFCHFGVVACVAPTVCTVRSHPSPHQFKQTWLSLELMYGLLAAIRHVQEAEVARLAAVDGSAAKMQARLHEADAREHSLEARLAVSEAERACLGRELAAAAERTERLERSVAARDSKVREAATRAVQTQGGNAGGGPALAPARGPQSWQTKSPCVSLAPRLLTSSAPVLSCTQSFTRQRAAR